MIAVVDSGVANLASVMAALQRLGADTTVTAEAAMIRQASHVILPGVGAAGPAMAQLQGKKLIEVMQNLTQPVLGICLGMQLLFNSSAEGQGVVPCLGIIEGDIRKMPASAEHPVPHMGWNQLKLPKKPHALLQGINAESYVYFVHSYAAPVSDYTLATADYGDTFTAVAGRGNFLGCQFHPEKSSATGSRILQNFLGL